MDGQKRVGRVKMTVQNSATLFVVACLVIPASGSAQTVVLPAPPLETPSPFRLFKDVPPEPTREWFGSIKSSNWWEPPASGSDIPRWAIGHTVRVKVPGGVGLSAGLFGRRGDPLPLYLSEVFVQPAHTSVTGPGYLSPAVGRETRLERARDRSPAIEARCGRRIVSSVDACCRHARTVVDVSERGDAPVQARDEVLGAQRPSLAATVTSLRCGGGRLQQPMGGVHRRWNEQENRRSRGLSALGWFGGPACYAGHGTTGSDRYTSRSGGRESVRVSIRVRPCAPRSGVRRTAGRS